MNCDSSTELMDLYLYGELTGRQEEELEQHLHGCAACQSALDRHKALHRGLDAARLAPPPQLLMECRQELFRRRPPEKKPSSWRAFAEMWQALGGAARPAGALALVALGFFSAR